MEGDRPVTMTVAPSKPGRFDRLHQVVRDARVHRGDAGEVDDDDLAARGADAVQELLRELACAVRIDRADDRQNQQSLAHLEHGRRQLADGFLLLSDDALALLDEADRHRVRDAVRGGLVRVENSIQLGEIVLVFREQRTCQHVAQQQNDADDFVRLDASRDDAFGQVAGVGLQRLERPGFERFDVLVVHGRGFREDLVFRHRGQQLRFRDSLRPFLAQIGAVLA